MWQQVVWRGCREHYAAYNIAQHDQFGGGSALVWGRGMHRPLYLSEHLSFTGHMMAPRLPLGIRMKAFEPFLTLC